MPNCLNRPAARPGRPGCPQIATAVCAAAAFAAWGQASGASPPTSGPSAERIEVTGTRVGPTDLSIENTALPAKVDVLDASRIERLNVRSYVDLFRDIPGVQSIHFGQGDIGAPFVMRGFGGAGFHGVATAVSIDGMPQNIPASGIGGNGATEYNWLFPELIERIEVIKGPFSALYGDQALAGAVRIVTRTCAPTSVGIESASYGLFRLSGVGCRTPESSGGLTLFGGFEAFHSDGYRARSKYDRLSLFGKATKQLGSSEVSLRAVAYRSINEAPGYLPFDDVKAGLVDPRSSPFASDGGSVKTVNLLASVQPLQGDAGWYGTAWIDRSERQRFASFRPTQPLRQNNSIDERTSYGGRLHHHAVYGERTAITLGLDTRHDRGVEGTFRSQARQRTGLVLEHVGLDISSFGLFVQAQHQLSDDLKLTAGYRRDRFEQTLDNRLLPEKSGSGSQSVGTARGGLAYRLSPAVTVFANIGQGFRSLEAFELSPFDPSAPTGFGLGIPKGKAHDIGFNARWNGWAVGASAYRTQVRNELRADPPDSSNLVNIGDSERNGYEIDLRWTASPAWMLYANHAHVDARLRNPTDPLRTKLENITPRLTKLGFQHRRPTAAGLLVLDTQMQHAAPETFYLNDIERRSDPYVLINLRATLEIGRSSITGYAVLEPEKFGSDQTATSFNPKPRQQFGIAFRYAL